MALRFCIKPCEDTIKFTVKGVEMELAYHAASALCTQIAEVLVDTIVHPYWKLRLAQKRLVNVHKKNRESYGYFLDRHGNPELVSVQRCRKCEPQPKVPKKSLDERRKEERQRFVDYWQKRLSKYQGGTPSQLSTSAGKDAHSENKDRL